MKSRKTIFGFAFQKNISSDILEKLENLDNKSYLKELKCVNEYCNFLVRKQPEIIIGMGLYSGKDRDKIRVETKCSNKFRNSFAEGTDLVEYQIDALKFHPGHFKYSSGIGNSLCNLVSFKIMSLIENGSLMSKYTFLHIPRCSQISLVACIINTELRRLGNIVEK